MLDWYFMYRERDIHDAGLVFTHICFVGVHGLCYLHLFTPCNPGSAPGMGPIRNPRWVQRRTEGYVIVSTPSIDVLIFWILEHLMKVLQETSGGH